MCSGLITSPLMSLYMQVFWRPSFFPSPILAPCKFGWCALQAFRPTCTRFDSTFPFFACELEANAIPSLAITHGSNTRSLGQQLLPAVFTVCRDALIEKSVLPKCSFQASIQNQIRPSVSDQRWSHQASSKRCLTFLFDNFNDNALPLPPRSGISGAL